MDMAIPNILHVHPYSRITRSVVMDDPDARRRTLTWDSESEGSDSEFETLEHCQIEEFRGSEESDVDPDDLDNQGNYDSDEDFISYREGYRRSGHVRDRELLASLRRGIVGIEGENVRVINSVHAPGPIVWHYCEVEYVSFFIFGDQNTEWLNYETARGEIYVDPEAMQVQLGPSLSDIEALPRLLRSTVSRISSFTCID
jgi:hypothetical protein